MDATDPANPVVVGSIIGDGVNMGEPRWLAVSPRGDFVYVGGLKRDSMAVVRVCNGTAA